MMKAVIIGAGVVGITTAYQLAKAGYQVTLLERHKGAALGTSYANGGQLSYHYKTPIGTPQILKQLPKILCGLDPAFTIRPTLDLQFYRWGLSYLWHCLPANSLRSSQKMRYWGTLAKKEMASLIADTGIDFEYRQSSGKLYLYHNLDAFSNSNQGLAEKNVWSPEKTYARIPALKTLESIVGGVYDETEDSGDCYLFCRQLLAYLQEKYSVEVSFDCEVLSLEQAYNSVRKIVTSQGNIDADVVVLAGGVQSAMLTRPLGIRLPLYPMKGYSITVPATKDCPDISVTDTASRMVFCRLGDRLRIAGVAEFSGYDTQVRQDAVDQLLHRAQTLLPNAGDYQCLLDAWCGLRPVTPNSLPIVGRSSLDNLLINTGHGMLGWTYATATAKALVDTLPK